MKYLKNRHKINIVNETFCIYFQKCIRLKNIYFFYILLSFSGNLTTPDSLPGDVYGKKEDHSAFANEL